jgi:hypothetical protein
VVKPDAVDAEFGHARGDLFGIVVGWEIRAEDGVHAEDAETFLPFEEMASFCDDESLRAGGFFQQAAEVCNAGAGVIPRKDERKERLLRAARESGGKDKGNEEDEMFF